MLTRRIRISLTIIVTIKSGDRLEQKQNRISARNRIVNARSLKGEPNSDSNSNHSVTASSISSRDSLRPPVDRPNRNAISCGSSLVGRGWEAEEGVEGSRFGSHQKDPTVFVSARCLTAN